MTEDIVNEAEALVQQCACAKLKASIAESCTGGLVAAAITSVPGSSEVFERGYVTYSNDAKSDMLGVDPQLLRRHGAVSAETACAMVAGTLKNSGADIAVAVTGIAGPGGGSPEKPVGLVFVAAARKGSSPICETFSFGTIGRNKVREASTLAALKLLRTQAAAGAP
jgi:nicotinamide-nucleotide amidase